MDVKCKGPHTMQFNCVETLHEKLNWMFSDTAQVSHQVCQFYQCYRLYAVLLLLCCTDICVALLLFVLSYVLIVCTVPLPPGVNQIAVDKYIKKMPGYN